MFEILPIFVAATTNQEHQSRLLVAKMVAKDFRPTNFLRGKRLKNSVKILSLRKAHMLKKASKSRLSVAYSVYLI